MIVDKLPDNVNCLLTFRRHCDQLIYFLITYLKVSKNNYMFYSPSLIRGLLNLNFRNTEPEKLQELLGNLLLTYVM